MSTRKKIYSSIGIVLAVVGISCMAMVKALLGSNVRSLSFIVSGLSVVFMAIGQKFRHLKASNKGMLLVLLYSSATLILCLFSSVDYMEVEYGLVYQVVYFIQLYLLWNVSRDDDFSFMVDFGFWVTGVFCTIALILLFRYSGGGLLFYNYYLSSSGEFIFNRSATGTLSYMAFIFSLAHISRNSAEKVFRQMFILVSAVVILFSTRRSVYAGVLLVLFIKIKNDGFGFRNLDRNKILKNILSFIILISLFYIAYKSTENVRLTIEKAWSSFTNGFFTIIGRESTDMAATMRATTSNSVIDQYLNHSTIGEFVFGRGYMTTYVDMPFIQAFWDMGLIGGVVFVIIQFIIPLKYILKKPHSQAFAAAQYIAAYSIVNGLVSNTPYGHLFNMVIVIVMHEVDQLYIESSTAQESLS